ncbi:MAG: hypothetical protein AAF525_11490 [Pseudomonadota bacterium]
MEMLASHREKVAWLSLGAMLTTFGPYLVVMAIEPPVDPLPDLYTLSLLGSAAVANMLILGVGHLWLRLGFPEDAREPADERDRAISLRAMGYAYYVLIAGMIVVGCVMPFTYGGWKLVNTAVGVIVVAQLVNYGIAAWSYRKGWYD